MMTAAMAQHMVDQLWLFGLAKVSWDDRVAAGGRAWWSPTSRRIVDNMVPGWMIEEWDGDKDRDSGGVGRQSLMMVVVLGDVCYVHAVGRYVGTQTDTMKLPLRVLLLTATLL